MSFWNTRRRYTLYAMLALAVLTSGCGSSGDQVVKPDDPTDLLIEWPSVCDEAFALAETGIQAGRDSTAVAKGIVDSAEPLFVECTAAVVESYPPSCLEVVTSISGMLEATTKDATSVIGVGADLIMRRSESLIQCDADHEHDVAE